MRRKTQGNGTYEGMHSGSDTYQQQAQRIHAELSGGESARAGLAFRPFARVYAETNIPFVPNYAKPPLFSGKIQSPESVE